jgi:hypothetical protein
LLVYAVLRKWTKEGGFVSLLRERRLVFSVMEKGKDFKQKFSSTKASRNTRRAVNILRGTPIIQAGRRLGISLKIKEKLLPGRSRKGKKKEKK